MLKRQAAGISAEDAKALEDAGVKAIDVGGVGGTSFAAVEYYRSQSKQTLWVKLSGIGASRQLQALIEATQTVKIPVIASGGVRSGTRYS